MANIFKNWHTFRDRERERIGNLLFRKIKLYKNISKARILYKRIDEFIDVRITLFQRTPKDPGNKTTMAVSIWLQS